jgi:hypothetical protein
MRAFLRFGRAGRRAPEIGLNTRKSSRMERRPGRRSARIDGRALRPKRETRRQGDQTNLRAADVRNVPWRGATPTERARPARSKSGLPSGLGRRLEVLNCSPRTEFVPPCEVNIARRNRKVVGAVGVHDAPCHRKTNTDLGSTRENADDPVLRYRMKFLAVSEEAHLEFSGRPGPDILDTSVKVGAFSIGTTVHMA